MLIVVKALHAFLHYEGAALSKKKMKAVAQVRR
jgi:hypothetical protein